MTNSLYALSIGTFIAKLGSLSHLLDLAAAHATKLPRETAQLGAAKLAPDMFPLARQVQLTCDHAKDAAARMTNQEAPNYANTEQTLEELQSRIVRTITYLRGISETTFASSGQREVRKPLLNNRVLKMDALEFLQRWALPQFYFHLVTTYAILRLNGVEIGKRDYLGDLSGFIHPAA